jgi:cytochrome c biogenesis protein
VSEPGRADAQHTVEVNAPLQVAGQTVHLLGHGYAPVVTVKDGNGDVAFSGPVVFLPQDTNFRSDGVIKAPDARPERLAFEGVFLPTAVSGGADGMVSAFPDVLNPRLLLNVWTGPPKQETGRPENVYSLDKSGLTQLMDGDNPVSMGLEAGTGYKLPDGRGSISFDGWKRWTKLQISNTPGGLVVLASVMLAVLGMGVSLTVKPRRLFVRVAAVSPLAVPEELARNEPASRRAADRDHPERTTISVAGLDRVEGRGGLTDEVAALATACGVGVTLAATEDEERS